MKNANKKKNNNYGVIINLLFMLYSFFARSAKNSIAHKVFLSCEKSEEKQKNSFFPTLFRLIFPKKKTLVLRRNIASALNKAPLVRHSGNFTSAFMACRCRDYGVFFISFGIYSLLGCIVGRFFLFDTAPSLVSYISCILSIFIALPLLKEKRSLGYFANSSVIAHFILFDVLGARKHEIYPTEAKHAPAGLALLLGMGFGLLSFIAETHIVAFFLLFAAISIWIFHIPESGVIVTCLILPFVGKEYTAFILLITLISFFIKVLQLKRTFKIGYTDFWVILLSFVLFTGASRSANGDIAVSTAMLSALFVLSFLLVKNLICTYEWIKRFFMSSIFSLTGVAFYSLIKIFSSDSDGIGSSLLQSAQNGISSVFDHPDQLALYVICSLPLLLVMGRKSEHISEKRIVHFIIFASMCSLLFTVSLGGYIAFFLTVYIFLLMYSKKTFAFAVLSILPVTAISMILSEVDNISLFNAFSSIDEISSATSRVFSSIVSSPLYGVGISGEINVNTPFYLCMASQLGIPCLIVFLIIIFEFFKKTFSCIYPAKAHKLTAKYSYFAIAPTVSVTAVLIFGSFSGTPFYPINMLMLFMLMGFGFGIYEYVKYENDALSSSKGE